MTNLWYLTHWIRTKSDTKIVFVLNVYQESLKILLKPVFQKKIYNGYNLYLNILLKKQAFNGLLKVIGIQIKFKVFLCFGKELNFIHSVYKLNVLKIHIIRSNWLYGEHF